MGGIARITSYLIFIYLQLLIISLVVKEMIMAKKVK